MNNNFGSSCSSGPSSYYKGYIVVDNLKKCIICNKPFYESFEVYASSTYGTISGIHNNKYCIEIFKASRVLGNLKKN